MARAKILIVDDEPDLLELLEMEFEEAGFEVKTCLNPLEVIPLILDQNFDAVLSDVRMPGKSGIEILKELSQSTIKIPLFYFLTGFTDLAEDEATQLGAKGFFHKPFRVEEIVRRINQDIDKLNKLK